MFNEIGFCVLTALLYHLQKPPHTHTHTVTHTYNTSAPPENQSLWFMKVFLSFLFGSSGFLMVRCTNCTQSTLTLNSISAYVCLTANYNSDFDFAASTTAMLMMICCVIDKSTVYLMADESHFTNCRRRVT